MIIRRLRLLALAAALAATGSAAQPDEAAALEAKDLTGWWIAVDPAIARLVEAGVALPMDEILIVNPDGTVEDRAMKFDPADALNCSGAPVGCSDAPLIARARLKVEPDKITFVDLTPGRGPIDDVRVDPVIRVSALTAVPAWFVQPEAGVGRLVLRAAAPASIDNPAGTDPVALAAFAATATRRTLVRIDPDHLRLLRAAMMGSGRSATMHWRCWLANATVGETAFAGVLQPRMTTAPAELPGYLRVSGYMAALYEQMSHPTPDHPNPDTRKAVGTVVERVMSPRFEDLKAPSSAADLHRAAATLAYVSSRGQGRSAADAQAEAAKISPEAVSVPLSDAELAAYAALRPDSAASSALFCAR